MKLVKPINLKTTTYRFRGDNIFKQTAEITINTDNDDGRKGKETKELIK